MKFYHTIPSKDYPRIESVDYNGYRPHEVLFDKEEGRFRNKDRAISDYKKKLKETIKHCEKMLEEAENDPENIEFDKEKIW